MSFIFAGIVFVGTLLACVLQLFAAGMSDAPSVDGMPNVTGTLVTGTIIALLIAASHWLPHIGW